MSRQNSNLDHTRSSGGNPSNGSASSNHNGGLGHRASSAGFDAEALKSVGIDLGSPSALPSATFPKLGNPQPTSSPTFSSSTTSNPVSALSGSASPAIRRSRPDPDNHPRRMPSSSSGSVESEGSDYGDDDPAEDETGPITKSSESKDPTGKAIDSMKHSSNSSSAVSPEIESSGSLGGSSHQRFPSDSTDLAQTPRATKSSYREKEIALGSAQLSSTAKLSSLNSGAAGASLQRPDTGVSGVSGVSSNASGNEVWSQAPDAPEVPKRGSSASHQMDPSTFVPASNSPLDQKDGKLASPTKQANENSQTINSASDQTRRSGDHVRRPSLSNTSSSSASDYGPEVDSEVERSGILSSNQATSSMVPSTSASFSNSTPTASTSSPPLPRMPSRRVLNSPPLDQSTSSLKSSASLPLGPRSSSPTKPRNQSLDSERNQRERAVLGTTTDSNLSAEAQAALEAEMQRTADAEDPARPKTLKEARALAKERARLRKERGAESISKSSSGGNQSNPSSSQPHSPSLAEEPPNLVPKGSQHSVNSMPSAESRVNPGQGDASESSSVQRSHSRSAADTLASSSNEDSSSIDPSKESASKRNEKRFGQVPPGLAVSPRSAQSEQVGPDAGMDELQAAVGAAMEDLSFSSSVTETLGQNASEEGGGEDVPSQRDPINQSNSTNEADETAFRSVHDSLTPAMGISQASQQHMNLPARPESTLSATSGSFVSASNSPPLVAITAQSNPNLPETGSPSTQYATFPSLPPPERSGPALPTLQSPPTSSSSSRQQNLGAMGRGGMGENYRYTDHLRLGKLEVQGRLEVYGKSVPWPDCFDPSSITEKDKKKAAPWERARAYAVFANELTNTDTRLAAWIETVKRPANRTQSSSAHISDAPISARGGHRRDEPSYAASVRSAATFPMRGDGAKAKDITPIPQAPDSPPSGIPPNIPYPTLAGNGGQFSTNPWPNQVSGGSSSGGGGGGGGALPSPSSPGKGLAARTRTLSGNVNDALNSLSSPASSVSAAAATSNPFNRSSSSSSTQPPNSGGRSGAERFFSSLGRKNSKRSSPSGLTMSSASTGGGGGVTGPRAPKSARGNISSPIGSAGSSSSPSAQRRSFDLLSSSDSPSGLGISNPTSPFPKQESPSSPNVASVNNRETTQTSSRSPLGPRPPGSQPSTHSPGLMTPSQDGYNLDRKLSANSEGSGGNLSVKSGEASGSTSRRGSSSTPTDYSSEKRSSPSPIIRSREDSNPNTSSPINSPSLNNNNHGKNHPINIKSSFSYGSVRKTGASAAKSEAFEESLTKLGDIFPDADQAVLAEYLKKANGDDLAAIGDYLQDQSTGKLLSPGKSSSRSPIRR